MHRRNPSRAASDALAAEAWSSNVTRGGPAKARATPIRSWLNRSVPARAGRKEIRTNLLIFFDSDFEISRSSGSALISSIGEVRSGKRSGREGGSVLVSFSDQDPVSLDRLQSRLPVITRNGKTGRSAGEAVHDTRACDKARSGNIVFIPSAEPASPSRRSSVQSVAP